MSDKLRAILVANLGKIFGSIMGLLLSWIFIRYGVLKGLFVVLCVSIGFYLGARLDSPGTSGDFTSRFF